MKRRLRFEQLDARALLAVLVVAPGADDNAAELLAQAVSQANETPEPDTIQLAAGKYDFSTISDSATLDIHTEIAIQGAGPDQVTFVAELGSKLLHVQSEGVLTLSGVSMHASYDHGGEAGALFNEGATTLTDVAVLGLMHDPPKSAYQRRDLVLNTGTLSISNSVLVDSFGYGINSRNEVSVDGTILAGNSGHSISSDGGIVTVKSSVLTESQGGIRGTMIESPYSAKITVQNSAIYHNETIAMGAGILFGNFRPGGELNIDETSVIAGNVAHSPKWAGFDDVVNWIDNTSGPEHFSVGAVDAITLELADRVGTDTVLVGTDISADGGLSKVAWDAVSRQFTVRVGSNNPRSTLNVSQLPRLDAGQFVGGSGGTFSMDFKITDLLSDALNSDLSIGQWRSWDEIKITSVTSASGVGVRHWVSEIQADDWIVIPTVNWLSYAPRGDFAGTDTIYVTGVDADGNELVGEITVDVVSKAGITLHLDAVEKSGQIAVDLTTQGTTKLSSFRIALGYDPSVVRPVSATNSEAYPFLQDFDIQIGRYAIVGGFRSFGGGADHLTTINFERIGPGSADIRVVPQIEWRVSDSQQTYSASSMGITYSARDGLDVNQDGVVAAIDALMILNALNSRNVTDVATLDANGDGKVTPVDALQVLNRLASHQSSQAEGSFTVLHQIFAASVNLGIPASNDDEDDDRNNDLVISTIETLSP